MNNSDVAIIVLAAGKGTRMESDTPKVLHSIAGKPMLAHVLDAASTLDPAQTVVVMAPDMDAVAQVANGVATVVQDPQLGTGHAVSQAQGLFEDLRELLVFFGDSPLITPKTLRRLVDARRSEADPAVVVLGFRPVDPAAYGRLVTDGKGILDSIVEFRDADEDQRGDWIV